MRRFRGPANSECYLSLRRRNGPDPAQARKAQPVERRCVETITGEIVCVRREPDLESLRTELQARTKLISPRFGSLSQPRRKLTIAVYGADSQTLFVAMSTCNIH